MRGRGRRVSRGADRRSRPTNAPAADPSGRRVSVRCRGRTPATVADRRRGRGRAVLGPWYGSGQVMRPERPEPKCTRADSGCPKCRAATGGPRVRGPPSRGLRTGRRVAAGHGSGRVHRGPRGRGPCAAGRTAHRPVPRRRPMGLPATKAQRSARVLISAGAVIAVITESHTRRSPRVATTTTAKITAAVTSRCSSTRRLAAVVAFTRFDYTPPARLQTDRTSFSVSQTGCDVRRPKRCGRALTKQNRVLYNKKIILRNLVGKKLSQDSLYLKALGSVVVPANGLTDKSRDFQPGR